MSLNKNVAIVLAGLLSTPAWAFTPSTLTDFDGDGVISADEIQQTRDAEKAQNLAQFDTDGDGELSRAERKTAKQAKRAATTAAYDTDGDGTLSDDEKAIAKEARKAAIEAQLDTNGDGVVSDAERAGFDQIMDERKDRKGGKMKGKRSS